MEEQIVIHKDSKYRMVIERAASTKGIDGFKVEANGDDIPGVQQDITTLYAFAKQLTPSNSVVKEEK